MAFLPFLKKVSKNINIMTDNKNLIYAQWFKKEPYVPKTYEVRYLENKEPSKLVQFASYLGLKTVDNCGSCGNDKQFKLLVNLRNAVGSHFTGWVYNTDQAESEAENILKGKGSWKGSLGTGAFRKKNREDLSNKINAAVREHKNKEHIIRVVYNIPD